MKISNLGKAGLLGLLLVFNTAILNAEEASEQESAAAVAQTFAILQYSSEHSSDSPNDDETDTTSTPNAQTQVNDNTNIIINNTTTSTPQCHQYGAFGECLY